MHTLMRRKKSPRDRIAEIGHSVSVHTAETGHKVREEFDDLIPKAAAVASHALHSAAHTAHSAAHTAAERSRPVRADVAARGSAALSGLHSEAALAQIEKISRRNRNRPAKATSTPKSSRFMLPLAIAGGAAAIWALWWKRSRTDWDARLEEVTSSDPDSIDDHIEGFTRPNS